jgi:hypothetical protein
LFKWAGRKTRVQSPGIHWWGKGEIKFQNKRRPFHVGLARVRCPCKKLVLAVAVHGKWRPYFMLTFGVLQHELHRRLTPV